MFQNKGFQTGQLYDGTWNKTNSHFLKQLRIKCPIRNQVGAKLLDLTK